MQLVASQHALGLRSASVARKPARTATPRLAVACKAHQESTPSIRQRLSAASAAALIMFGSVAGSPALASEFDLLAEPKPTSSYYIDDAGVLSISSKSDLDKKLRELEEKTGYRLEVATLRKLEYESDAFAFSDKILGNWYNSEEIDKKGLVLVLTSGKEGAISGGKSFLDAIGDDLLDSIVGDDIPILTEEEKFNQAAEVTVSRISAKLEGKEVPDGPLRKDTTRRRTFRSKEETEKSKSITSTVVLTLLVIAFVVPMLQYYGYVAKD